MPGVLCNMEQAKVLVGCSDLCGESPIWDVVDQQLYWTDCVGLKIHQYDWPRRRHERLGQGWEVNSFTFHAGGGFVVANNSGLWLWSGSGAPYLIADTVEGIKSPLNDSIADVSGRVLVGSWFYDPKRDYPLGHLIRVDPDGRCNIVDEGIHLANGLAFSPDDGTLYFADSARRLIYAYDYDKQNGAVKNRRVFVSVPATEGIPDGLAVDAEGFVWAAQWYGGCVDRYDPDGKLERRVEVPAKQVSNLAFGGPELTDIFITTAAKSEPMPVMPPNYDPDSGEFGGPLYHVNLGIQGKPEHRTQIRLEAAKGTVY
jgi:sugar lactone lactonase YvrE